jgi:acid phosphatase
MSRDVFKYIVLFAAVLILSVPLNAKEPENLHTAKQAGIFYHNSGEYDVDREKVAQEAISFLSSKIKENNALAEPEKLAVVFDIDETSLSNYEILLSLDFAFVGSLLKPELEKAKDPAVMPTLKLYEFAKKNGVAMFFITGRRETMRAATEENLKKVGYTEWVKLYMKPDDYAKDSVIPYKSGSRKSIADEGYSIVVNIGDQWSDLAGGYSERTFKLPNPYYYVP